MADSFNIAGLTVEEGVKKVVDSTVQEAMKRFVEINNSSEKEQIELVHDDPQQYKYIIKPSEAVTAMYEYAEKL